MIPLFEESELAALAEKYGSGATVDGRPVKILIIDGFYGVVPKDLELDPISKPYHGAIIEIKESEATPVRTTQNYNGSKFCIMTIPNVDYPIIRHRCSSIEGKVNIDKIAKIPVATAIAECMNEKSFATRARSSLGHEGKGIS